MDNKMNKPPKINLTSDISDNDLFFIEMMYFVMDQKMMGTLILRMNDHVQKWKKEKRDDKVEVWQTVRDRLLDRYLENYRVH